MARNDNDVQYLFNQSLNGVAQPLKYLFINATKRENTKEFTFGDAGEQDSSTKDGRGELGMPVYGEVTIEGGNYVDPDGNTVAFNSIEIDTVILIVNQTKNIVKTAISGRNGTVKEYINDGDYEVQITGILSSGTNNVEPVTEIDNLVAICKAQKSLKIANNYLDRIGITEIVIESYSFPQREGFRDNFFFSINAVSNKPIELRIKEDI
jgi:hypothetical protein